MGNLTTTASGKTCQRWDSATPHSHDYTSASMTEKRLLSELSNYCTVTVDKDAGPYCYTEDPDTPTEACNVPLCRESDELILA